MRYAPAKVISGFCLLTSSDAFSCSNCLVRNELVVSSHHYAHPSRFASLGQPSHSTFQTKLGSSSSSSSNDKSDPILADWNADEKAANTESGVDIIFNSVDTDGSGTIDQEEFKIHLSSAGYSKDAIESFFVKMDTDQNGEISRDEFRRAILDASADVEDDECPMGYFLNSVQQTCEPLGPLGRFSQKLETMGPFKKAYKKITTLFGVDKEKISKLGVSFLLSYSVISNINGALSLSVAWYMTVKRTGLSPLVPGQWRSLLSSYAMIYGAIQLLKPFRVAAAIAMSKLSAEYLEMTESKLNCSRGIAIGCQYAMGVVMMAICAFTGISIVSMLTGVPMMG